jgi:hypothetical protein
MACITRQQVKPIIPVVPCPFYFNLLLVRLKLRVFYAQARRENEGEERVVAILLEPQSM